MHVTLSHSPQVRPAPEPAERVARTGPKQRGLARREAANACARPAVLSARVGCRRSCLSLGEMQMARFPGAPPSTLSRGPQRPSFGLGQHLAPLGEGSGFHGVGAGRGRQAATPGVQPTRTRRPNLSGAGKSICNQSPGLGWDGLGVIASMPRRRKQAQGRVGPSPGHTSGAGPWGRTPGLSFLCLPHPARAEAARRFPLPGWGCQPQGLGIPPAWQK